MWQVELDPYCRRVLEKHFPSAQRFDDVRTVGKHNLPWVDVISGGFPCQDISNAGKRAGIEGERSGLWSEYARIVRELRPRYVVVENVAALLGRGMERVLGDLAESGYDAEWQSIRASDVGAPHRRERVWIVAYAQRGGSRESTGHSNTAPESLASSERTESPFIFRSSCKDVVDARCTGFSPGGTLCGHQAVSEMGNPRIADSRKTLPDANGGRREQFNASKWSLSVFDTNCRIERSQQWATEPDVGRVAHGISARVDRLKGLGNAIVPQIAEWIGRRIVANGSH